MNHTILCEVFGDADMFAYKKNDIQLSKTLHA